MLCIVNYGSGNIAAIANICQKAKIEHSIVSDPKNLVDGSHFLLPGVGAFDPTMEILNKSGIQTALEEEVVGKGKPVLGICVGMHLLAEGSEEGDLPGLGWVPGHVRKISVAHLNRPPHLPHMGWNSVALRRQSPLFEGCNPARGYYFLHSFYFDATHSDNVLASVEYGGELPCVVNKGRVFGAQFHPEKSHGNGIQFIKNFARLR
jgi:glutamine amidotransferase